MALIPEEQKILTTAAEVNTTYGGPDSLKALNTWYTMSDIVETVQETIPVSPLYSATFFDTTTQTNAGATVANQVRFDSVQRTNGFSLGPDNRIEIVHTDTYFINLQLQLAFTGGASSYNVTVWFTIDDVIVPNSAYTFTTTGAQNDQTLASITDTIEIQAGQYIKFYWWTQATGMKLLPTAAGTNPTRPLSPSANFSIFNVG